MKKWLALLFLALLALGGYVAAGPYLAIRGISQALEQRDAAALERYVDFPTLRVNLKAQVDDALLRRAGPELQAGLFGGALLSLAGSVSGIGVDAMVTPAGIGALLQGDALWKRASGDTVGGDSYAAPRPPQPLRQAEHRFESTSRFVATLHTADGTAVPCVFTRDGLRWKLSNILLPL
ncbi:DUF2939 domain-containing protein [Xanthomonas hyacinthi]|uniref:DUF2939 domain-containing protein n=1 Tax=Xanthomonas hyacinthi TaxID=56455 RepID=A0A2S7F1W7_9XANT|nr:DUF2939 domain-containing protein [Xanthomonas hyacinthi]KLD77556.1 hypothetical protein Y886_14990 [Xanthomonas hyacinthi DSM 19077]PPU99426.1 DUF2939 domain-containing protein [Xanthomonas hyacinthi]QGY78425.1 DUF2939 domain-containing protein [Xanthomonas hyacinthi]